MIRIERQQDREGDWLLVSLESALYVVILIAAVAMRFSYLGYWPLLSGEVRQAWEAWNLLQGGIPETTSYSPLLFTGNLFNFFAFGASDAVARLWPVLFGAILVFLPYLLRNKLGRAGALVAAALLALSPTFLYFSRVLDGNIVAAACALALVVVACGYISAGAPDARHKYLYAGAIILPLALMSGPTIYTFGLAALCFVAYIALSARRGADSDERTALKTAWQSVRSHPDLRMAGMLAAAILVLIGSALVFNISGWQATLNQLGQWLQQFTKSEGAAIRSITCSSWRFMRPCRCWLDWSAFSWRFVGGIYSRFF